MGHRLVDYFERAERLGGVPALVRLASLTLTTSLQARVVEDTPELVARFERAFTQLSGESRPPEATPPHATRVLPRVPMAESGQHLATISELVHQRSLFLHDPEATLQRVTEACATTLRVGRASVWFYDEGRSRLVCRNLFEVASGRHSSGLELLAGQAPRYFKALRSERVIAAVDVASDPRTSEFQDAYSRPLGIGALLDAPVWSGGRMVGVVCNEHLGGPRSWSNADADFSLVVAGLVAMSLEGADARGR